MRVLVTGSEGYIGAVLTSTLLARGHDVVGLDSGFYREGKLYEDGFQSPRYLRKDIRRVTMADVQGYEAVVHLAELSNDPLGHLNPRNTHEINHAGSVRLAEACKSAGVARFIYSSSCSVYGVGTDEARTEESETNPQTPYATCKVLVERDLARLADDDFSPTILRNATAYGASPRMRFDLVLNNLAGWAWTTGDIVLTSDGTPWRPLVHVLDISLAVACALEAPRRVVHNEIFNVGDNQQNYRVREIAGLVAEAFAGCRLVVGQSGGDTRSYRVAFDKISAQLPGFRCAQDASKGATELRALFERLQLSREQFEARPFTRVKQLQHLIGTGALDAELYWTTETLVGDTGRGS